MNLINIVINIRIITVLLYLTTVATSEVGTPVYCFVYYSLLFCPFHLVIVFSVVLFKCSDYPFVVFKQLLYKRN